MESGKVNVTKMGEMFGFISAYLLFSTIFFFILEFFDKIPKTWNYLHIMGISFVITLVGIIIKRYLK